MTSAVRQRRGRLLTVVTLLILLAGLATGIFRLVGHRQQAADVDDVLSTARRGAVAFTSYDVTNLDASFAALLTLSTTRFREQYTKAGEQLRPLIAKKRASATGQVLAAGLERYDDDAGSASVLVAADSTVTNTDFPKGAQQRFRLRVELRQEGGHWRIDAIGPVL